MALDAGYDANLNYEAIVGSGREPYINQRRGSVPRGFGEGAKAMRRYLEDPDDFAEQYGKRNSSEAPFSSMKERMGAGLRSKTLRMQTVDLFARVLCHNLTACGVCDTACPEARSCRGVCTGCIFWLCFCGFWGMVGDQAVRRVFWLGLEGAERGWFRGAGGSLGQHRSAPP